MNNNIELYLLKLFLNPEYYNKYNGFLRTDFLKSNSPILSKVFQCVGLAHEGGSTATLTPSDLEVLYLASYPAANKTEQELIRKLCDEVAKIEANPEVAEKYVTSHLQRARANEIAILGLAVSEGREPYEKLADFFKQHEESLSASPLSGDAFVSEDLNVLLSNQVDRPGLRWRLNTLNRMLGSLRKGDFGFIFKRPETGGTTFLASECTFFAGQSENPVLHFNNEEQGEKVLLRYYEAYFGKSLNELAKDRAKYAAEFKSKMGGRILIRDSSAMHRRDVERIVQSVTPCVIVIDQLDKVKGFDDDRDDLELKAKYQWARELAKAHAPLIGVCQASVTAEGKKYLTMDDVDRSKTAKQGEADWIMGIGKSYEEGLSSVRFLNICKNKLVGDADSDPGQRHGKAAVRILPEIARYEDIN